MSLGLVSRESSRLKTTAAPRPAEAAVNAPEKMPRSPFSSTAFLMPLAMALPKPVSGTVAPAPAQSARGW